VVQKSWKAFITSALLAGSSVAIALPFNSFDPRSMAMGGAGVAVGDAKIAPFFNPALLTVTREDDDFSLALPIIGVRAYDPEKFATSLDDFQKNDYVGQMDTAISNYNLAQTSTNLNAISTNASTLSTQFTTLSDKPIQAEFGAGFVIGIPSKSFGMALYGNGWGAVGGIIKYRDDQTLQNFISMSNTVANTISTSCAGTVNNSAGCVSALLAMPITDTNPNPLITTNEFFTIDASVATPNVTSNFNSNNLQSSVDIRGVVLSEAGFALSHEFNLMGSDFGVGITPKVVRAMLLDYTADVNNGSTGNATDSDFTAKYTTVNFDLGLAKDYANGWRTGFVIKNVIPHKLDFKRAPVLGVGATPQPTGDTVSLRPQARVGVSHSNSWSTAALDVDLTANDPAGFENKSQYVALGGELNAWDIAQLRVGYRADLKNSNRSVASAGIGLGPFDLAVSGSANEVGASASFGFTF